MDTDITMRNACVAGSGNVPVNSPEWWRQRSPDELREMINRGFAAGDLFAGAAAEAARRSDEARRIAEEDAARLSAFQRQSTRKRRVLLLLVGVSLIATMFTVAVIVAHVGLS